MNKEELIEQVQQQLGDECSRSHAKQAVESVLASIQMGLRKGEDVTLTGFGSFSVRHRAARKGINPQTREPIEIGPSKSVGFKPGKPLKDSL